MEKLALLGGEPVLKSPLPEMNNIGEEETRKVLEVLKDGELSGFLGRAGPGFLGGKVVKELEGVMKGRFGRKYAVAFNSATTALDAAVCALGIGPGDEVIVSPFTMSASAASILINMAVPVFADIDSDTYCLDPASIRSRITKRTRAIMVTNLFGGSARYDEIMEIAGEHGLGVIEDNAQGAGGEYKGKPLGSIADIGVFSFNIHKIIQSGEGGVLLTDNERFAFRAQLRRNHGESVLDDLDNHEENIVGSNYRMAEIIAAVALEQFKKLGSLNKAAIDNADYLTGLLKGIPGIEPVSVLKGSKHVYYYYPFKLHAGISRQVFAKAMKAEGFDLNQGYMKPLYMLPCFQDRRIFPNSGLPFEGSSVRYDKGICPVCESLSEKDLLLTFIHRPPRKREHIDLFIKAIKKVLSHKGELR